MFECHQGGVLCLLVYMLIRMSATMTIAFFHLPNKLWIYHNIRQWSSIVLYYDYTTGPQYCTVIVDLVLYCTTVLYSNSWSSTVLYYDYTTGPQYCTVIIDLVLYYTTVLYSNSWSGIVLYYCCNCYTWTLLLERSYILIIHSHCFIVVMFL